MSKSNPTQTSTPVLDYWKIFSELPDSYLLFEANDPTFTIVEANKVREQLTGVRRKNIIGKPLFEIHPDTTEKYVKTGVSDTMEHLRKVVRTGKLIRLGVFRYDILGADGNMQLHYWQSTYVPLVLSGGKKVTHILAATRDVTDERSAEQRIETAEERLEAALSIGKVGSWVWDVGKDNVIADKNLLQMFGIKNAQATVGLPIDSFLESIHTDDRKRVRVAIRQAVKGKTAFEQEYRTFTADGKLRWVLARGKVEMHDGRLIFPGVIVDITERRDLQAQVELARRQDVLNRQASKLLQQRNEELEAIGRTKDEFVALASHQLRTPATAVKQYLGMVLQGYVGDVTPVQMEMLEKAFESNERQIQIINQILNAARVDTGRLAMTNAPLDLRSLAQGVADEMRSSLEQRKHTFVVRLPKQPVPIVADMGYLRMAVENLLHNASIYTPEGGRIEMKLEVKAKRAHLSIIDNGVGIRKADTAKLFAKFSRIHNSLSVQAGGSGIGLFLAAEIVRLHGGGITVESKINRGTTFAISLPLEHNTV